MESRGRAPVVISVISLFVALGGSSYAISQIDGKKIADNSITGADIKQQSLKAGDIGKKELTAAQIKKESLTAKELKKNSVTGAEIKKDSIKSSDISGLKADDFKQKTLPAGPAGPIGPIGPAGPPGPSEAITTAPEDTTMTGGDNVLLTLDLPAGSWVVMAHVGGAHDGAVNFARFECILRSGTTELDFSKLRVEPNADANNSLVFVDTSLHGAVTLAAPGTVTVNCGTTPSGESWTITARRMTAIKVGALSTQ